MIYSPYTIRLPRYWMVEDKPEKKYSRSLPEARENLLFHISSDDYFGTLATSLNLLKQSLEDGRNFEIGKKSLAHSVDDLMYLQRNYKITKK
ncbi:MAG TPA: hypothetical protein VFQ59_00420 [Candidatus Paceibacterota bacterium]|nr:hypothetical protein [Candidatus Paceibacterota bacterium]